MIRAIVSEEERFAEWYLRDINEGVKRLSG
jgi:hypothetical protein